MRTAFCPDCDALVNVGPRPKEGQRVTCQNCGTTLEVISLQPLELDWVYEAAEGEEDWEDDGNEDW